MDDILDSVVDFSLVPNKERTGWLTTIAEAIAEALPAEVSAVAKTLAGYLSIDENTVFGFKGRFPGTLSSVLVMTPIKVEAFIAIMAGRYEFANQGGGIFLPKPKDVVPYRGAEFILVGAIGGNPNSPDDVKEIARYARGSFIVKSAWKRTINVIGITKPGLPMDAELKEVVKGKTEEVDLADAGYLVHIASVGPLWRHDFPKGK